MKKHTWLREIINYHRDNPQGYWFKKKLYGWGWVPVKWQGWIVILISVIFVGAGVFISEIDDAPGAVVLGIFLAITTIFYFGFKKGEKPSWQWGLPDNDKKK